MLDIKKLAEKVAELTRMIKTSVTRRGRAGRRAKGKDIGKQLHAAGQPHGTRGVMAYPKGRAIK